MSLVKHAKREFEVLGWPGDCEMQKMVCDLSGLIANTGIMGNSYQQED